MLISLAQTHHMKGSIGIPIHFGPMERLIKNKDCRVILSYYVDGSTVYQGLGATSLLGNANKVEADVQALLKPKTGWKYFSGAKFLSRGPRPTMHQYVHANPLGREWILFGIPDGSKYCLVTYKYPLPSRDAKMFIAKFGNQYRANNSMRIRLK